MFKNDNFNKNISILNENDVWTFYTQNVYICHLMLDLNKIPVTQFCIKSEVNSYNTVEVFVLSQIIIEPNIFYKKEVLLELFLDKTTNQYLKCFSFYLYEIYSHGSSYLLDVTTGKASPVYVYKLILHDKIYQLTYKTKNYIYQKDGDNLQITDLDAISIVLKDQYNYSFDLNIDESLLNKYDTITQYQETDYNFVIRRLKAANLFFSYDFSSNIPVLYIAQGPTIKFITLNNPSFVKNIYQFNDIKEFILCDDGTFSAIIISYEILAGSTIKIDGDILNTYFVTSSEMTLQYRNDGQWILFNYIKGMISHLNFKFIPNNCVSSLFIGSINGIVVTNKKNTFYVNENGMIKVRIMWNTSVINSEQNIFGVITQGLSENEQIEKDNESKNLLNSIVEEIDNEISSESTWDISKDTSSITTWIPIANWGSSNDQFGNFHFPRGGEEVALWFIEGNLDHPIVMGNLYNNSNLFPNVKSFNISQSDNSVFDKTELLINNAQSDLYNILNIQKYIVDLLECKIPSDCPLIMPNISDRACDVVFKNFSFDKSKITTTGLPSTSELMKEASALISGVVLFCSSLSLESFSSEDDNESELPNFKDLMPDQLTMKGGIKSCALALTLVVSKIKQSLAMLNAFAKKMDECFGNFIEQVKKNNIAGYNQIYMENVYMKEKVHLISSNLLDIRSFQDMHIEVKERIFKNFASRQETVISEINNVFYDSDNINVFNNCKITYISNNNVFQSKDSMKAISKASIGFLESIIGSVGSIYEGSFYQQANYATVSLSGFISLVSLKSDIVNVCNFGIFYVYTNDFLVTALGSHMELIMGNKSVSILGYYSLTIVGYFSIMANKFNSVCTVEYKISCLDINIYSFTSFKLDCFNFKMTSGNVEITSSSKMSLTFGNTTINAASVIGDFKNLNIKCMSLSNKAASINVKMSIFSVTAAGTINLEGGILTISSM